MSVPGLAGARRDLLILLLVCGLMFWWRLGSLGLIDPDEPFYAQSTVEMMDSGDWLAPRIFGHPQFEKPILFYWASMASFAVLGRNELGARAPGALAATLLILMVWAFAARAFGRRSAFLAALVLATTVEFAVTARFMLTDMVLALFVCGACFAWVQALERDRDPRWLVAAFASSAVAVLVKGPIGLLVPGLAALATWAWTRRRPRPGAGIWIAGIVVFLAIAAPWYVYTWLRFGDTYLRQFFVHENLTRLVRAEHPSNDHFYYYPAVLIAGSLPWIPALAVALRRALGPRSMPPPGAGAAARALLTAWFLSSLAFFTLAHSKLPTYVLFLFVPVALLVGRTLDSIVEAGLPDPLERRIALGAAAIQGLALFAVFLVPAPSAFFTVAGATAAALLLAAAALARRSYRAWIGASAAATAVLLGVALAGSRGAIEAEVSCRPAGRMLAARVAPGDPLLISPMLARGLYYYAHRPVVVVSDRPDPFFTPHPLRIVNGREALRALVEAEGPRWCLIRQRDWSRLRSDLPRADSTRIGDKLVLRLEPGTRRPVQSPVSLAEPTATRLPSGPAAVNAVAETMRRQPIP